MTDRETGGGRYPWALAALGAAAVVSWAIYFGLAYSGWLSAKTKFTYIEFKLDPVVESAKGATVAVITVMIGLLAGIPLRRKGWWGIALVFLLSLGVAELLHFWAWRKWEWYVAPACAGMAAGLVLGDLPARGKNTLVRLACCGGLALGAYMILRTGLPLLEMSVADGESIFAVPWRLWLGTAVAQGHRWVAPWLPFVFAWLMVPALSARQPEVAAPPPDSALPGETPRFPR